MIQKFFHSTSLHFLNRHSLLVISIIDEIKPKVKFKGYSKMKIRDRLFKEANSDSFEL